MSWNTHTLRVKSELTNAGYKIIKNDKQMAWEVVDGKNVVMYHRSLGELMKTAEKQFGIN